MNTTQPNKSGKLRIAFATPSLGIGGRERVLSLLINFFCEKNELEVHLILYGKNREIFFDLHKDVMVHEPDFDFNEYPTLISTLRTLWFLRTSFLRKNIDIIVSFEEKWNRFVLLSSIGINKRFYISNRNHPHREYGRIDRMLAKFLYPKAEALIAQTAAAKSVYEKKYRLKKCVIIGNPIKQIEGGDNGTRENIVISVGRLMISKYHDRLINIFAEIDKPNWKLIIVGGDFANHNRSEKLKAQIDELGLGERVILTGYIKDVQSYLLKSKIFAFTSDREGFPNAIGEAMAVGLPVIAYDCLAGPSEMIDDGENGYLVPVFDDQLFRERLELLMNDEEVRAEMGRKAKEKIKLFDSEIICQKFYDLIALN